MLPCQGCAYRENVPGSAHSRCVFDWMTDTPGLAKLIATARLTPRTAQWFRFPWNFDPLWGPDTCPAYAETRDPEKTAKPNPISDLLSLLR